MSNASRHAQSKDPYPDRVPHPFSRSMREGGDFDFPRSADFPSIAQAFPPNKKRGPQGPRLFLPPFEQCHTHPAKSNTPQQINLPKFPFWEFTGHSSGQGWKSGPFRAA